MKIELYEEYPSIKLKDINKIEKELNIEFPEEYIQFMLTQNGGDPKINQFTLPDKTNTSNVNYFYPIGEMQGNLKKKNDVFDGYIPKELITIGCDSGGNQILLRIKDENIGEISFWYHDVDPEEEDPMHLLANSLKEFLAMLK